MNKENNNIMVDENLKDLFELDVFSYVYRQLERLSYEYYNVGSLKEGATEEDKVEYIVSLRNSASMHKELFLDYLDYAYERNKNNNFYERVLFGLVLFHNEEYLEYLLSQDLNMNYEAYDSYGHYCNLAEYLANNIKTPKAMKLLLEKVKDSDDIYYWGGYGIYTDLCRMNITANNLDKALEIFNSDFYNLLPPAAEKLNGNQLLMAENGLLINEFNAYNDDGLFCVLKTLRESKIEKEDKKNFLNEVLYSDKVKLFNVYNLEIIRSIYDDESYENFIDYLKEKTAQEKIVLYSIKLDEIPTYEPSKLGYETVDTALAKVKVKKNK